MRQEDSTEHVISGRILVTGTGYVVLTGMWLILAYFRQQGGQGVEALIDVVLAVLHLVAGIAIYYRLRPAWYGGLVVAALGVAGAIPNAYPFPVGPEIVIGLLLYFGRRDFLGTENVD